MRKIKNALKSVRVKLFMTLSLVILLIIFFLIIVNNFVFEQFYLYSKTKTLISVYDIVNSYYNNSTDIDLETELQKISIRNNFDILIRNKQNVNIFTTDKNFFSNLSQMNDIPNRFSIQESEKILQNEKLTITKIKDNKNGMTYVLLAGRLDNDYILYIRIPITSIQESVKISNNFLYLMAGFTILISAIIVSYVSRKFTDPILELNDIAKKMSNLDFSLKYKENVRKTGKDNTTIKKYQYRIGKRYRRKVKNR